MIHDWLRKVGLARLQPRQADRPDIVVMTSCWVDASTDSRSSTGLGTRFDDMRQEFEQSVEDIEAPGAIELRARIRHAQSRQELWYLRGRIFDLVARAHSQEAAQRRLRPLDRFFRQGHSGPVPL